ncbi:glutathione S-transferase family protein [Kangiella sediminilitoris]|uniref:Glutathione S-transferase protein n=1 Tax=Kangiella sediminilitoris TaxID=1144748 RepID=A0A1B3BC97_9GAMM|nr:glutathione S-transferase family protein [Kangiella sediminilitoris]AOE50373.1 Glutathione S-transferase protein [Kangiella sediminilitoris]
MPVTSSPECNLIFYTNPQSRGQIARWMLEEVGAEYRQEILQYGSQMKSEEYLNINPMGKVPTIVHNGKVVTECAAICAYLADAFPEAGLAPSLDNRVEYYRWLFFSAGPLEAALVNRSLDVTVKKEQETMVGYGSYDRVLDVLSERLQNSPYIAGNEFTAADVYVGSHILWGLFFGTMDKRPGFKEYSDRLVQRSAFIAAKKIDEQLIAEAEKGG